MQYLGGKSRSAPLIAPYLTKWAAPGVTYWEPFMGAAGVAVAVVAAFPRAVLSDAHGELIELWRAVIDGWTPPDTITEDQYNALRQDQPSALRTLAGFGASFGGKWWGGYARPHARQRDHAGASCRSLGTRAAALRAARVELRAGDYRHTCQPSPGDVVYLDPPYEATTGYKGVEPFDHDALWTTAAQWARDGVHVYVSEFAAPPGWRAVWSQQHRNELRRGSTRTDALFEPTEELLTMTTATLTAPNQCEHPAEALSALPSGVDVCTACQTRFGAPQETGEAPEAHTLPARKWGDEPDPIPAAPTVLVASTDPYVNEDGDGARQYAPKPALAAAKDAFAGGWRYQFTYAAASVPARGEPGKRGHKPAHVLHTIALRLARDTDHPDGAEIPGGATIYERGYAIWAREDPIATPDVEGKWAWVSADINGRSYGARELRARLLRHGRELLNDPPVGTEPAAPVVPRGTTPVPVAPIVPGSWGSLHAGDTVTGGDGRPYVVQTIGRTGMWVGSGYPEVKVTLAYPDGSGEITVRKSATEPAVIAERSDTSQAATAVAAAFNVTEETTMPPSTEDQFSAPAAPAASITRLDPPKGRYGWYKLPHPITGAPEALWPRVSTIIKTHADKEGLTDWEIRMAMKGLAVSPDLIAMVASLDVENDKGKFREAAEQASNRAQSKKGANFGTAVDRFTERLDAGESIASMGVPEGLRADVEAYASTLRDHGLEVLPQYTQRTTVNVTHEYAGTWDRVVRRVSTGELFMLDLKSNKADAKTGGMSNYSWLEYVSQLGAYAYGEHMCTLDFAGYEPMPEIDKTKGLILHLPSGKGRGELYGVLLERGWRNFVRSIETRKDRSEAKSSGWSYLIERKREATPAPATPAPAVEVSITVDAAPMMATIAATIHELVAHDIAKATTIERLGEIARNAIEAGVWSDALATLALGRDDQIRARTAADQGALGALWIELHPLGRWTDDVAAHADARAAELAQLVSA